MTGSRDYDAIITRIRDEANSVKNCFTTFSFQAIAFAGIILTAIVAYQPNQPFVGLAGILIIVLVLTVSGIGNYKYATANRHFGFELYLNNQESRNITNRQEPSKLEWEQGLRAWRVVQASMFDEIYYTKINTRFWNFSKRLRYNRVRDTLREKVQQPSNAEKSNKHRETTKSENNKYSFWFEPDSLLVKRAQWYPGRYLHTMQSALHFFAYLSLLPLLIMILQFQFAQGLFEFRLNNVEIRGVRPLALASGIITIMTIMFIFFRVIQIQARRKLLESGLLSIHACAIVWHVVELAHERALKRANQRQDNYIECLSEEADAIRDKAHNIYEWIEEVEKQKHY